MAESHDIVSVERVIAAPPDKIFALVADPARHHEFDGSGTVRDAKSTSGPLTLGSKFGMSMKAGISYSTVNTVVEFDENRRIAWQTGGDGKLSSKFGGRIWRYELEPVDDGAATRVRESWDISQEKGFKGLVRRAGDRTRRNMDATLERIEQIVTA